MTRFLLLAALFACNTATLDQDVCGNGVVEKGEDCDSDDKRCVACGITCNPGHDQLSIAEADASCATFGGTDGFVCGADGFCHAPRGEFEQVSRFSLPTTAIAVTDVNGDGVGEVLVQSQTSITAVFGAGGGGQSMATIQTPIARGAATFAHVDGDTSIDTLLPTADGIVSFTSAFGVPAPFPFSQPAGGDEGGTFKSVMIRQISPFRIGAVVTDGTPQQRLFYFVLDTSAFDADGMPTRVSDVVPVCGGTLDDFVLEDVDTYSPPPSGADHQILALTLHPESTSPTLCVLRIDERLSPPLGELPFKISPITPAVSPVSRPVLGDLRGTPACPSLVVSTGADLVEVPPIGTNGSCGFAGTAVTFTETSPDDELRSSTPVALVPLQPPIAGASDHALATSTGIFSVVTGAGTQPATRRYKADRPLDHVRAADLDNDGDLDLVASSSGADDLDILDRRDLAGFDGFLGTRFDTTGPVTTFELGDYDGNGIPDVAFVESAATSERLAIAYGTTDSLLPGQAVGAVHHVAALVPAQFLDSGDPHGVVDDLVFVFEDDANDLLLSLLHGSTQRTMLAFFDPRITGSSAPPPPGVFRAAVVGSFSDAGNHNDVLAILDDTSTSDTRLFLSAGAANGGLDAFDSDAETNPTFNVFNNLSAACLNRGTGNLLCLDTARYLTLPISGGHDDVLAVDGLLIAVRFDPSPLILGVEVTGKQMSLVDVAGQPIVHQPGATLQNLQRIDVDGAPRVVISTGPEPGGPVDVGKVYLCDPQDTTLVCTDLGALISETAGEQVCVDAANARVTAARRFEAPIGSAAALVVLCHDTGGTTSVFRVPFDASEVALLGQGNGDSARADSIHVGDVSGDGIDDVVLVDRNATVPFLTVFRQCNSRDVGCGSLLEK